MSITKVNTKKGKIIYAIITILFAIGFPLILLKYSSTKEIKINVIAIPLLSLYVVAVAGLILLIFKIEDIRLKLKVLEIENRSQGRVGKFNSFMIVLIIICIVYSLVKLYLQL